METKDHLLLARHIIKRLGKDMKGVKKAAFIIGNVLPDMNPFSYITFGRKNILGGHSLEYRKESIQKYLSASKSYTTIWWYGLGKTLHYLCDSFTSPHIEITEMTLSEHAEYERRLHFVLITAIKQNIPYERCGSSLHQWLEKKYEKHSSKLKSLYSDSQAIINASLTVFYNIYIQSLTSYTGDYA